MDNSQIDAKKELRTGSAKPVVCVCATGTNDDEVARTILRARHHDHDVIVVSSDDELSPSVELARESADVTLVPVRSSSGEFREEVLNTIARMKGYPGIIYQRSTAEPIDYERTLAALADDTTFGTEAVPRSRSDASSSPTVLVGIPVYNESETIADVVRSARKNADEVIVVDDGSTDRSAEVADAAGATVMQHAWNQGYGAALKTLFSEAKRRDVAHLVVLDGDGQHDPDVIPELIERQREGEAEIVIGSRLTEEGRTDAPLYRRAGLRTINLLTNFTLGTVHPRSFIHDTQSGLRSYSERAIESLSSDETIVDTMGASTDILHHAHRNGYAVEEVGTTVKYDVENANHHTAINHGLLVVHNILRTITTERPILSLALPGLLCILAGLGFGYWAISIYLTRLVFPPGLALAATAFTLAGMFAVFTAIILYALRMYSGLPTARSARRID